MKKIVCLILLLTVMYSCITVNKFEKSRVTTTTIKANSTLVQQPTIAETDSVP